MNNYESLKVAIVEPSIIVRNGVVVALKRMPKIRIQTIEILSFGTLSQQLILHKPEILIINPTYWGTIDVNKLKEEYASPELKCLALLYAPVDESLLKQFDDTISIFDSVEQLSAKIDRLTMSFSNKEHLEETNLLSAREKEIVCCVVKGMTNKEIANALFLSQHTVITHRRNIARKLEIHSTAGLTVYAIVNNLVELEEVKKKR